jgi:hypothetical protein
VITIASNQTVYFDVDETLVLWNVTPSSSSRLVEIKAPHFTEWLLPHHEHIERLKRHKRRGDAVVVWSQGGALWAEAVVTALGLTEFVDACLQKPSAYYDDLPAAEFMGSRLYFLPA